MCCKCQCDIQGTLHLSCFHRNPIFHSNIRGKESPKYNLTCVYVLSGNCCCVNSSVNIWSNIQFQRKVYCSDVSEKYWFIIPINRQFFGMEIDQYSIFVSYSVENNNWFKYPKSGHCETQGKQTVVPNITCIVAMCNIIDTEKNTMQYFCKQNISCKLIKMHRGTWVNI